MSHDWLTASTKEGKYVVHETPLRSVSRNRRRKHVEVTNLPQSMNDILGFHPVHGRLDSCVCRPLLRGKSILDFANGTLVLLPECLHNLELELRQFRRWHGVSYMCSNKYHHRLLASSGS